MNKKINIYLKKKYKYNKKLKLKKNNKKINKLKIYIFNKGSLKQLIFKGIIKRIKKHKFGYTIKIFYKIKKMKINYIININKNLFYYIN